MEDKYSDIVSAVALQFKEGFLSNTESQLLRKDDFSSNIGLI